MKLICTAIAVCIVAVTTCGCAIRHDYTWKEYTVDGKRISSEVNFDKNQEVKIVKGKSRKAELMLGSIGVHQYYGNEQTLTDGMVTQLTKEMRKRQVNVKSTASKSLEITVNSTTFERGMWKIAAVLNYTVKFGNGKTKSYSTRNSSPATVPRTFNGAVCLAVVEIINDPEVQAYINN